MPVKGQGHKRTEGKRRKLKSNATGDASWKINSSYKKTHADFFKKWNKKRKWKKKEQGKK